MGKATQDLRKEHESIIYVLEILDNMMRDEKRDEQSMLHVFEEVVYFLKIFADQCHHGKEEEHLFEEMVKKGVPKEGGPIGVMLTEHAQGRAFIAQMENSLLDKKLDGFKQAAVGYRDLLRKHIDKENNILFMMADRVLDEVKQNELFEKFEQHEETVIGHGVHEKLHAMIDRWAQNFPPQ